MNSTDEPITEGEQALIALTNLVTAMTASLATNGQADAARAILDGFGRLNDGSLPPGFPADMLQMTVKMNLDELARHEVLSGKRMRNDN